MVTWELSIAKRRGGGGDGGIGEGGNAVSCDNIKVYVGGSSSTPYFSVGILSFKCKSTSSLSCMRHTEGS